MKNRIRTWAAPARRAASLSIAVLLTASMLFYGAPFALVGGALQGTAPAMGTASAEELGRQTSWADQIDTMLGSGSYNEGEVVAIVAPAAQAASAQVALAAADEGVDKGAGEQPVSDLLLDCADTEELAQTTGDAYESAFNEALPEAALQGAQVAAAAESGADQLPAVQSSDVELYTLLVKQEGMSTEQMLRELANDPRVVWAQPNYTGTVEDLDSTESVGDGEKEELISSISSTGSETGGNDANGNGSDGSSDGQGSGADGASGAGNEGSTGSGSNAKDKVQPIEKTDESTVASADDLADGTSLQWGYADESVSAYGSLHKEGFDVGIEDWNDSSNENAEGVIAIVDTGIDYANPDLSGVMFDMSSYASKIGGDKYGFNSTGDGGDSGDVNGHGTHCAGIAAAAWNGYGVSGAANGANLISVRAADSQGQFTTDSEIKGFAYIERAVDAGVDVRVASNSWGAEGGANRALFLAAESLGQKGVAIVFASGNAALDVDKTLDTAKIQGASDYCTVVDAAAMTGVASDFSNYGKTTTDVFAPGTNILSTAISQGNTITSKFIPSLIEDKTSLAACSDFSEGSSTQVEAWVGLLSLYDDECEPKRVGKVDTQTVGFDSGKGVLRITKEELEQANVADSSKSILLSLKVPVSEDNWSKLSNIGISVALDGGAPSDALGITALMFESVDATGKTAVVGGYSGFSSLRAGWNALSNSAEKALMEATSEGSKLAVHTDADGNSYILMNLVIMPDDLNKTSANGILIDCVGAGTQLSPYMYESGTSMATPCVAGLAAVASKQMEGYSSLDKSVRAAALTRVLKSSVTEYDSLSGLCSSNGMIDASKFSAKAQDSRVPTIVSAALSNDGETVSIKGDSFGSEAGSVSIGGKSATVKSWSENEVVAECPTGLISGYLDVALTRSDKQSCSYGTTFVFTKNVSADEVPVYERVIETPEFLENCSELNTLAALDGSLYVFGARDLASEEIDSSNEQSEALRYDKVWRYEIASKTWSEMESLPCRLANVSCTLWDGKMLVMGSAASADNGGLATKKLFSYDPATAKWTDLSEKVASDDVPYQASIVNVGDRLLLIGGSVVSKIPEDDAAAEKAGVWVSAKYSYDNAKILVKGDTTLMTLTGNNVREFDLDSGEAKVVGSCSPRSNTGLARSTSDIQTALCGDKLYVFGGARSDISSARKVDDSALEFECLTLGSDGSVTSQTIGSYNGTTNLGVLPPVAANYELAAGLAASADGPVLAGLLAVAGYNDDGTPTSDIVQNDTLLLGSGDAAFKSIGKRVNYTPTVFDRAIAYRGMLYVLGHDYDNSYETVMRATAVATNELPGDVVRDGGGSDQPDESDGTVKPAAGEPDSDSKGALAKTGDATAPAAAVVLAAGGLAAVAARRSYRKGAARN